MRKKIYLSENERMTLEMIRYRDSITSLSKQIEARELADKMDKDPDKYWQYTDEYDHDLFGYLPPMSDLLHGKVIPIFKKDFPSINEFDLRGILQKFQKIELIQFIACSERHQDILFAVELSKNFKKLSTLLLKVRHDETASRHNMGRKLYFDENSGDVVWRGQRCHITTPGYLQYLVCKALFTKNETYIIGSLIDTTDIEYIVRPEDAKSNVNTKWLRDAVDKINQKIKNQFGKKKLINFNNDKMRIMTELFE